MKLVVFGASGKTGIHIVKQALGQGHEVTAFVRDVLKLSVKHENLTAVTGNVLNSEDVEAAIQNQDAVLVALGTSTTSKNTLRSDGTKNIIDAMQKATAKRLIVMTTMGAHDSWAQLTFAGKAFFRTMLKHVKADHELQEDYVKASGLDWTIVRPSGLTDGEQNGNYKVGTDSNLKAARIARADVAEFMIKQLHNDTWMHKAVSIT